MTEHDVIQTPFGVFAGVSTVERYPSGAVRELRLRERNLLVTHAGDLVPFYGEDSLRRKYKASVSFFENGTVRSVSLEEQQEVETPIGGLPAELVTFYETGQLKRVFPLDGKISGFWSEEEERQLNIPLRFSFDFGEFTAMLTGICFYPDGNIRSLTLFPGESIRMNAPGIGPVGVKTGFSLFESGTLSSLEPAVPTPVKTPIGTVTAYDTAASGIHADRNSLRFDEQGRILGLVTSADKIAVRAKDGGMHYFAPAEVPSPLEDDAAVLLPLAVTFDYEGRTVSLTEAQGETSVFSLDDTFLIYPGALSGCTPQDCAGCSLCSH